MNEMIVRVASAIHGAITDSAVTWGEVCEMAAQPGWSEAHFTHKTILDQAQAAITAMREPTDDMVVAAWNSDDTSDRVVDGIMWGEGGTVADILEYDNKGGSTLVSIYQAMIDKALSAS